MSTFSFSHIVRFFKGDEACADDHKALVNEALLMTLSRGTNADTNIAALEVDSVCAIYKKVTGEEIQAKDVRIAAISDLFKEATLERYLAKASSKMTAADRTLILTALADVIKVDGKLSPMETDFFNSVAKAFGLSHAEVAGLCE